MELKEFGRWMEEVRRAAGFESQAELAVACKVHASTISKLEKGGIRPTPDTLKKLAPHLKVSYSSLLEAAGHLYGGGKDNEVEAFELPENVLVLLEKEMSFLRERLEKIDDIIKKCKK